MRWTSPLFWLFSHISRPEQPTEADIQGRINAQAAELARSMHRETVIVQRCPQCERITPGSGEAQAWVDDPIAKPDGISPVATRQTIPPPRGAYFLAHRPKIAHIETVPELPRISQALAQRINTPTTHPVYDFQVEPIEDMAWLNDARKPVDEDATLHALEAIAKRLV